MKTFVSAHAAEPLEARIAPAVFFLSGLSFDVFDDAGDTVKLPGEGGADFGVKLVKGDSLVLDTNGNQVRDGGEVIYAQVLGGVSEFFAKNLGGGMGVDAGDLTGIAVGDGFNARINGNINGSVVTMFSPTGVLDTSKISDVSIAGLVVTGGLSGSIHAGRNISGVDIHGSVNGTVSVDAMRTGTEASGETVSFNGGTTALTPTFIFGTKSSGGNISGITLGFGANAIEAGDGNDSATGAAGSGGNVSKVTIHRSLTEILISGGDGGDSTAAKSKGGNGGGVSGLSLTVLDAGAGTIRAEGGQGGDGNTGGSGGTFTGGNFRFLTASDAALIIAGGEGGAADQAGGGSGGGVRKTVVTSNGALGSLELHGGEGGLTLGKAKGGKGGEVTGATIGLASCTLGFDLHAGNGGPTSDGKGGEGGAVRSLRATIGAISEGSFIVSGGEGGGAQGIGDGGVGGGVFAPNLTVGAISGKLSVTGGTGGAGAKGGSGGGLAGVIAHFADVGEETTFSAADGGAGVLLGGLGGAVKWLALTDIGASASGVTVSSGAGGDGDALGNATGGNAGSLSMVTIEKSGGGADDFSILSGTGGPGGGSGNGGAGGSVKGVRFTAFTAVGSLDIGNLGGGGAGATAKSGGTGGSVETVKIISVGAPFLRGVFLYAGAGGDAAGPGAKGGPSGRVTGLALDASDATVRINSGNAFSDFSGGDGGTGATAQGGAGGGVSGITGKIGTLIVSAMSGGDSQGKGGGGGSVTGVKMSEVSVSLRLLRAGDGGDGAIAGQGGSVSGITVPGDIGVFSANFNLDADAVTGMGGIVAGLGGRITGAIDTAKNGSVTGITADRIAAIVAGAAKANALTTDNAVSKIAGIKALVIGADVNRNGFFDFTDNFGGPHGANGLFLLGDGDTTLDGLVIVKTGGAAGLTSLTFPIFAV